MIRNLTKKNLTGMKNCCYCVKTRCCYCCRCNCRAMILNLTKKVKVSADDALSKVFPGIQAAIVTIRTKGGEWTERVDFPKGEPENPLTDQEFKDRYNGLMEYGGVSTEASEKVFDLVYKDGTRAEELVKEL